MAARLVARNRDDVVPLHYRPSYRQLRRRCSFFFGDLFELGEEFEIVLDIARLKPRMIPPIVVVREILDVVHRPGEETASEWRIGHEAHVELAAGLNVAAFGIARPER